MRFFLYLFLCVIVVTPLSAEELPDCTAAKFALPGGKECEPDYVCEGSKEVVGPCINIHGFLRVRANFMIEIKADGYDRLFWPNGVYKGVVATNFPLPANVANALGLDNGVLADYRICPLEPRKKPQWNQQVCVERAKNIEVVNTRDIGPLPPP